MGDGKSKVTMERGASISSGIDKDVFQDDFKQLESKYVKAEPGRFNFNRLGWYQKRNQNAAISLFKKYSKLRLLTPEEEIVAGKFASLAQKLYKVRGILVKKLDRDPSDDEWASACRLSVDQLESYLEISKQSRIAWCSTTSASSSSGPKDLPVQQSSYYRVLRRTDDRGDRRIDQGC